MVLHILLHGKVMKILFISMQMAVKYLQPINLL
nr:MAG TPA: hypothetical protein [Caudoviricetes sp.]